MKATNILHHLAAGAVAIALVACSIDEPVKGATAGATAGATSSVGGAAGSSAGGSSVGGSSMGGSSTGGANGSDASGSGGDRLDAGAEMNAGDGPRGEI